MGWLATTLVDEAEADDRPVMTDLLSRCNEWQPRGSRETQLVATLLEFGLVRITMGPAALGPCETASPWFERSNDSKGSSDAT